MTFTTILKAPLKAVAALALLALPLSAASAQTSSRTGTISTVFLAGGNNYGFRVTLTNGGQNPLSDCQIGFAYLNVSHDNYAAMVATLLTDYVQGKPVELHVAKDANGFCEIGEFIG